MKTKSFNYGYCAFYTMLSRESNPFKPTTVKYLYWIQGYAQAEIDFNNHE